MGGAVKALGAAVQDVLGSSIRIGEYLVVPQPQHRPTLLLQKCCPLIVVGRRFGVLAAVQLHSEPRFAARHIDDVPTYHELTRKPRTISAQPMPQEPFGFGRSGAQMAPVWSALHPPAASVKA